MLNKFPNCKCTDLILYQIINNHILNKTIVKIKQILEIEPSVICDSMSVLFEDAADKRKRID